MWHLDELLVGKVIGSVTGKAVCWWDGNMVWFGGLEFFCGCIAGHHVCTWVECIFSGEASLFFLHGRLSLWCLKVTDRVSVDACTLQRVFFQSVLLWILETFHGKKSWTVNYKRNLALDVPKPLQLSSAAPQILVSKSFQLDYLEYL